MDQVKTLLDMQATSDDRLWIKQIPESDLRVLLWIPHEYVRDMLGSTLNDAFTILYRDRDPLAEGAGFVSEGGLTVTEGFLVTGFDRTGLLMIEGARPDPTRDPGGGTLPHTDRGFESAFEMITDSDLYVGLIHGDIGENVLAGAGFLDMAIRYRGQLSRLLSSQTWKRKVDRQVVEGADRLAVTLADDLTVFYQGTRETMAKSCHKGKTKAAKIPDKAANPLSVVVDMIGIGGPNTPI